MSNGSLMKKHKIFYFFVLLVLLVLFGVYYFFEESGNKQETLIHSTAKSKDQELQKFLQLLDGSHYDSYHSHGKEGLLMLVELIESSEH